MTDRDTFAAAALTGYTANPAWDDVAASIVAEQAYADADAMLRERDKTSAENTSGSGSVTLTDEEREAIDRQAKWLVSQAKNKQDIHSADLLLQEAATLRKLLSRLGVHDAR